MKGCKFCPAFGTCEAHYRGSSCAAMRSRYGIDSNPEIITNADNIRTMDDEELAEFLAYTWATSARAWQKEYGETLYWLQQPWSGDSK